MSELTDGVLADTGPDSADETASSTGNAVTEAPDTADDIGGGPTRTTSATSADDILERATRGSEFETIAAEHVGADPAEILDEGVPPEVDEQLSGLDDPSEAPETGKGGSVSGEAPSTVEPTTETDPTDGPLARAGGVEPDETSSESSVAATGHAIDSPRPDEIHPDTRSTDGNDRSLLGRLAAVFGR